MRVTDETEEFEGHVSRGVGIEGGTLHTVSMIRRMSRRYIRWGCRRPCGSLQARSSTAQHDKGYSHLRGTWSPHWRYRDDSRSCCVVRMYALRCRSGRTSVRPQRGRPCAYIAATSASRSRWHTRSILVEKVDGGHPVPMQALAGRDLSPDIQITQSCPRRWLRRISGPSRQYKQRCAH
jgi:hypothetical protein